MTMMAQIRNAMEAAGARSDFVGSVYFKGIEKQFDKLDLSEDGEVLIVIRSPATRIAIRISSIDAIEISPLDGSKA